ncbi:MAG: hypothetical protein LBL61_05915 [Elusimicrobiota bacterium]|jgi:hypothetical protein|nr:hypothetical protein [Elusimicrobiota bacterium]
MQILWRVLLLAALHFGALVCFPDYTAFAPITVFIIFLISCAAMVAATSLMSLTGLGRYFFMNRLFEIIMLVAVAAVLLIFTPQLNGTRPFDRVMAGNYPTKRDIDRGLAKFGLKSVNEVQSKINSAAGKIGDGLNDAKSVIVKEANQ